MRPDAANCAALFEGIFIIRVHFEFDCRALRHVPNRPGVKVNLQCVPHPKAGRVRHGQQHEAVAQGIAVKNIGIRLGNHARHVIVFNGVHRLFSAGSAAEILARNDDVLRGLAAALPKIGIEFVERKFFEMRPIRALLQKQGGDDVIRVDVRPID